MFTKLLWTVPAVPSSIDGESGAPAGITGVFRAREGLVSPRKSVVVLHVVLDLTPGWFMLCRAPLGHGLSGRPHVSPLTCQSPRFRPFLCSLSDSVQTVTLSLCSVYGLS
jgi:hypothetical protein